MKVMRAGAVVMIAALAAGTAAAAPKTLKFIQTTVTDGAGMHMNVEAKVWIKGQKARVETNDPRSGPMLLLVDGPQIRRLYPRQKRGIVSRLPGGKNGPANPWEFMIASVSQLTHGAKKLGEERLDGYLCDVYVLTHRSPSQNMTVKSWVTGTTQPRLPLRIESTSHQQRPNATVNLTQTIRITGLKIGVPLSDALFAVPAGYKIVQDNGPGMPGAPGPGPGVPRH